MGVVSKEWECVYIVANVEGNTNTEVQNYIKIIRLTCQRKKLKHLTFCVADQFSFFGINGILEAYFCNSCTDL